MFVYSLFICMSKHGSRPHLQYLLLTLTLIFQGHQQLQGHQSYNLWHCHEEILGHLWYLSEELVALAFFDDKVPNDAKWKMVLSLQKPAAEHPLKRANVDPPAVRAKQLEDFVTFSTCRFFNITGFSASFLDKDVEAWTDDENYKSTRDSVRCMRVVNDIAERGVALMDEYNKVHTTDE